MSGIKSTARLPIRASVAFLAAGLAAQTLPEEPTQFFGLDKIWDIHITVPAESWDSMYPTRLGGMLSQRGVYPYVKATVRIGEQELVDIGLRFKGNSTFWSSSGTLKRSFKLDFDRFAKKQNFLGLTKLNLQNNATDPTQIREAVSYRIYRDAGIAASRTAFARVHLTVPQRWKREYLGLYTIVEQVDRRFLKHHYGSGRGLIAKPEGKVLPYLGDVWNEAYARIYTPKTKVESDRAEQLIRCARLIAVADRDTLAREIHQVLDVDAFLRYVAVSTVIANLDSPMTIPHNFYLIVPRDTDRVVWVPWDLNLTLGGFVFGGSGQAEMRITDVSRVEAFRRVLELPAIRKRYLGTVRRIITGCGSAKRVLASIEQAKQTVAAAVAAEADRSKAVTDAAPDPVGRGRMRIGNRNARLGMKDLERFVVRREKSVVAQLDGKSRGRRAGFSMGSWMQRRSSDPTTALRVVLLQPRYAGHVRPIARKNLHKSAARCFADIDRNESQTLDLDELAPALRSRATAKTFVRRVDADGDELVSLKEWREIVERGLIRWDRNQDGELDERELAPRRRRWR